MHAASREALAAAELRLLDVIDGADDQGLVTLGEELFAVVRLLIGEHALRRAVSDPSAEPQAREGLVRNLLASKVGDGTLKVLSAAVTARWSSARELLDGLESLARTALLVRAERGNRLDAVEDELFRLGRIIAGQAELAQVLGGSGGNAAGKAALVDSLVAGKVEPVTEIIVAGLEELTAVAARRRERSVAYVRSAVELTAAQVDRLASTLARIYGRQVVPHVEIDPAVRGGLVVKVGDEVIDGSVAGQLDLLRRNLAG
jgi:F-type H+-transporting ATPase subunit delta